MLDEKKLRLATKWLYDNRHTGYWTFPILLSDSVSAEIKALSLTADDASAIFDTLEELGFLKKLESRTQDIDGTRYQMYRVNYAKVEEYYSFARPPFYFLLLPDAWIYRIKRAGVFGIVVLTVLLTAIAESAIGAWFDHEDEPKKACVYLDVSKEDLVSLDLSALADKCVHVRVPEKKIERNQSTAAQQASRVADR